MNGLLAYHFWGLTVSSETAWPDLAPFALPRSIEPLAAQVVIRDDEGPAVTLDGESAMSASNASFWVAGVGRYEIRNGAEITVMRAPAATAASVQLFLFGSAWGLLCYQRGLLPLHAAVVEVNGAALAFCGPSGAGKSTVAASLVGRGHLLLSDDLCRVEARVGRPPQVWPGLPRFKLWRQSLQRLGRDPTGLLQDQLSEEKFHVPSALPADPGPRPLRGIYLLEWGDFSVERLAGTIALRQFVAAGIYRRQALARMGRLAEYWHACAEILRGCQIYRLRQPADWSCFDAALKWVEAAA